MADDAYDEIVTEFYGIDPVSLKVDNATITRAGIVAHWTSKLGYVRSSMTEPGALQEIKRKFGCVAEVELHPRTPNKLKILMELQVRALVHNVCLCTEGRPVSHAVPKDFASQNNIVPELRFTYSPSDGAEPRALGVRLPSAMTVPLLPSSLTPFLGFSSAGFSFCLAAKPRLAE